MKRKIITPKIHNEFFKVLLMFLLRNKSEIKVGSA